jgi:hypothetical protein
MIRFTVDASTVGPYTRRQYLAIVEALTNRLNAINIALQSKIVGEKLEGQVLQSHTHKLASSVRVNQVQNDGTILSGGVQAGGGPAFYAKFQEEGTQGPYTIAPKDPGGVLAFIVDAKQVFVKQVTHPGLEARSFMESTLLESKSAILNSLKEAVREAVQ